MSIITSFLNTPQAKDDYYSNILYNEDYSATVYFDVMSNDLGGKAKVLWAIDDGINPFDLLNRDLARAESMSSDYSRYGASIWIQDGKIAYNFADLNNNADIQALNVGESLTDTFTYSIRMANGALSWATVFITIDGANDAPVAEDDFNTNGMESGNNANLPPVLPAVVSGNVLENDDDVDNNSVLKVQSISLIKDNAVLTTEPVASTGDTIIAGQYGSLTIHANGSYEYTINNDENSVVDKLNVGESRDDVFKYVVSDGFLTDSKNLTITIKGANDGPKAVADIADAVESGTSAESDAVSGNVLKNDTDVDNNVLANPDNPVNNTRTNVTVISVSSKDINGAEQTQLVTNNSANVTIQGLYGVLTIQANGMYSYEIDNTKPAVNALQNYDPSDSNTWLIDKFDYRISDNNPSTPKFDSSTLTITIQGTNDAPTAVADIAYGTEDSTADIKGNILANDTDVDNNRADLIFQIIGVSSINAPDGNSPIISYAGLYGKLTIYTMDTVDHSKGYYEYVIDNTKETVNKLNVGSEPLNDVFNYIIGDNDGFNSSIAQTISTLTIKISGENDAPTAVADIAYGKEDDSTTIISGNVLTNDSDVDNLSGLTVTSALGTIAGTYGTLTMNANGSYTYVINNANSVVNALNISSPPLHDIFNYTVSDNNPTNAKSASSTLDISISGSNDAPVAVADVNLTGLESGDANPSAVVSGNVLANDLDVDNLSGLTVTSALGTIAGTYGTLTMNANGSYTYVINNANSVVNALNISSPPLHDIFNYTVSDNNPTNAKSASSTLDISIKGANDGPVAYADSNASGTAQILLEGANLALVSDSAHNLLANDTDVDTASSNFKITGIAAGNGAISFSSDLSLAITGTYGKLTVNSDGSYSYQLNAGAITGLDAGGVRTDHFTYQMSDKNPNIVDSNGNVLISGDAKTAIANLNITINGVTENTPPNVIVQNITENAISFKVFDTEGGTLTTSYGSGIINVLNITSNSGDTVTIDPLALKFEIPGSIDEPTSENALFAPIAVKDSGGLVDTAIFLLIGNNFSNDILNNDDYLINPESTAASDPSCDTMVMYGRNGDDSLNITNAAASIKNYYFFGGNGNDILTSGVGSGNNVVMNGGSGNDKLTGGNANDMLMGGNDNDKLEGRNGDDTLIGGSGDDTLIGGAGADLLSGGAGKDIFYYNNAGDSTIDHKDVIQDFTRGEDKINLSAIFGPYIVGFNPGALGIGNVDGNTVIEVYPPAGSGTLMTIQLTGIIDGLNFDRTTGIIS